MLSQQMQQPQQAPQQQGGSPFGDPNLMLGLALMTAGNSKDPGNAIFSAISQMQQAQQFKAQQAMQAAQLALEQKRFAIEAGKYNMEQQNTGRSLQAGQDVSAAIGQEPSMVNNFQGTGLEGGNYSPPMSGTMPNYAQGQTSQSQYQGLDPASRVRYETARALALSGHPEQAAQFLPEQPKPFSLSPGQAQYSPDGKLIATNVDTQKTITNEKDAHAQWMTESKNFQDMADNYARFAAITQDPKYGKNPIKDMAASIIVLKMMSPTMKTNADGTVSVAESGGLPDQLAQQINNAIKTNGSLSPEMRVFVKETGEQLFKSQMNQQKLIDKNFTKLAEDNGWNPSHVVGNYASITPKENKLVFNPKTGRIES